MEYIQRAVKVLLANQGDKVNNESVELLFRLLEAQKQIDQSQIQLLESVRIVNN